MGRDTTFTVDQAWRASASTFSNINMVGDSADVGQDLRPIAGTGSSFNVILTATVYNGGADWFLGSFEVTYTYASDGLYTAEVTENCCRLSSLENNANGDYRLVALVNVVENLARQGPVSTVAPIVTVTTGIVNSFMLPTTSPDDNEIRFRLATSNEVAGTGSFTPISGLTIDAHTGLITWLAGGVGLYSTAFVIEGFTNSINANAGMNVQTSTIVDFLIESSQPVGNVPYFSQITEGGNNVMFDPMSNDNVVVVIQEGETLDLTVYGADADMGDTVTVTPTTLPSGSSQTSTPGNPGSFNVMWTAPMGAMTQVICYTVSDDNGNTATGQLCVEVQIGTGAVGDPHITSFWGCHIDAPKSEERAVLMTCPSGESLTVSYYAEFDYRIRTVWIVKNGKKEHYKWKSLKHSQKKMVCGNAIEFHRYHAGINIAVKTISNRNIGGMFNDTSCYADKSKAVFAHSGNSY